MASKPMKRCSTSLVAAAAAKSLQSCLTLRPHRQQPTRLRRPWESPGKNTGVGCHFLLQCMTVKSESEVAQSCPTVSHPMDCSLPASSIAHSKGCLFTFLIVSFIVQKHLSLIRSHLFIFAFVSNILGGGS